MESSSPEEDENIEENKIKNVRNLFRLKREINDKVTKDIRNLFKLEKVK